MRPSSRTLQKTRGASVGRPEAISHGLVQDLDIDRVNPARDVHDAPQAHLDPQQITDMTPIFRWRELAPDEIEEAMKPLGEGEELSTICQRLGVTPATLRQQVLQMLWNTFRQLSHHPLLITTAT